MCDKVGDGDYQVHDYRGAFATIALGLVFVSMAVMALVGGIYAEVVGETPSQIGLIFIGGCAFLFIPAFWLVQDEFSPLWTRIKEVVR